MTGGSGFPWPGDHRAPATGPPISAALFGAVFLRPHTHQTSCMAGSSDGQHQASCMAGSSDGQHQQRASAAVALGMLRTPLWRDFGTVLSRTSPLHAGGAGYPRLPHVPLDHWVHQPATGSSVAVRAGHAHVSDRLQRGSAQHTQDHHGQGWAWGRGGGRGGGRGSGRGSPCASRGTQGDIYYHHPAAYNNHPTRASHPSLVTQLPRAGAGDRTRRKHPEVATTRPTGSNHTHSDARRRPQSRASGLMASHARLADGPEGRATLLDAGGSQHPSQDAGGASTLHGHGIVAAQGVAIGSGERRSHVPCHVMSSATNKHAVATLPPGGDEPAEGLWANVHSVLLAEPAPDKEREQPTEGAATGSSTVTSTPDNTAPLACEPESATTQQLPATECNKYNKFPNDGSFMERFRQAQAARSLPHDSSTGKGPPPLSTTTQESEFAIACDSDSTQPSLPAATGALLDAACDTHAETAAASGTASNTSTGAEIGAEIGAGTAAGHTQTALPGSKAQTVEVTAATAVETKVEAPVALALLFPNDGSFMERFKQQQSGKQSEPQIDTNAKAATHGSRIDSMPTPKQQVEDLVDSASGASTRTDACTEAPEHATTLPDPPDPPDPALQTVIATAQETAATLLTTSRYRYTREEMLAVRDRLATFDKPVFDLAALPPCIVPGNPLAANKQSKKRTKQQPKNKRGPNSRKDGAGQKGDQDRDGDTGGGTNKPKQAKGPQLSKEASEWQMMVRAAFTGSFTSALNTSVAKDLQGAAIANARAAFLR